MKTAQPACYGSIQEFITATFANLPNEEHVEAAGRDIYETMKQIVFDNGFSARAQRTFPRLRGYKMPQLIAWARRMNKWQAKLSTRDSIAWETTPVIRE